MALLLIFLLAVVAVDADLAAKSLAANPSVSALQSLALLSANAKDAALSLLVTVDVDLAAVNALECITL